LAPEGEEKVKFEILIRDSGLGISLKDQSSIFYNFSKLADEEGLNKSGTGLGLSICKQLVEMMGGEVTVNSDGIGHGTTFGIEMLTVSKPIRRRRAFSLDRPLRKVLVINDDIFSLQMIEVLL
jgi:signal transduction histidine kinase